MTDIEEIKAKLPLEELVGETVVLKPAGRDVLKGLCPLHVEKTPSFQVNTATGRYFCFSCRSGGDLFEFVQQTLGIPFSEAKVMLAERTGVTLTTTGPARKPTKDLADLQTLAQGYFQKGLSENPAALEYLLSRGLTRETITEWGIGYAPNSWHGLIALARGQGVETEALERAGLAKSKDGRPYDMFRARVTIPIHDAFGRIVGFSARALGSPTRGGSSDPKPGDVQPKYLNTPETELFKKGDILFGLHRARHTIREKRAAIMVEGQLDVIMLHQAGFTAAVGGQSSTLTPAQITLFDRLGLTTLYMAFDADEAGQKATLSGLDAVARQFLVKVIKLPGGDPADVVKQDPEAFRDALKRAVPETQFRLERALDGLDVNKPADKQVALERLKDGMRDAREPFDPVAADLRRLVSQRLGVDEGKLARWAASGPRRTPVTALVPRVRTADVRHEIMALALNDPERLRDHVERIGSIVNADDALLAPFVADCERYAYNLDNILRHYTGRDDVAPVLEQLAQKVETKKDLLGLALNRYVRAQLPPGIELSAALAQVMRALNDPAATAEDLEHNRTEAERLMGLMQLHVALR